jgi:hypothetical protein
MRLKKRNVVICQRRLRAPKKTATKRRGQLLLLDVRFQLYESAIATTTAPVMHYPPLYNPFLIRLPGWD